MSNIVKDNSNTIFSSILGDLKNLRVIFYHANKSEQTIEDYTKVDDLDIAATARELQKSLEDIENGKHLEYTTPKVSKQPQTIINSKVISNTQIKKIEKSTSKTINREYEIEDR